MTENIPPLPTTTTNAPAASTTTAPSTDPTRGLPYYEKLKRDLRETLQKKRALDKSMQTLEDQIYRFEASYLEETATAGNIIRGFDNYIKGSSGTSSSSTATATTTTGAAGGGGGGGGVGGGPGGRRKTNLQEHDRVFSRSSASFMREVSPGSSSAQTTPGHGATPTSAGAQATTGLRGGDSKAGTPTGTGPGAGAAGGLKKGRNAKGDAAEEEGKGPKRLKITYARGGGE